MDDNNQEYQPDPIWDELYRQWCEAESWKDSAQKSVEYAEQDYENACAEAERLQNLLDQYAEERERHEAGE